MEIHPSVFFMALLPIAGIIFFVYRFTAYGKGAFFGGPILRTHETIHLAKQGPLSGKIQIHEVRIGRDEFVGIEITKTTPISFSMHALLFTKKDIRRLSAILKSIETSSDNK
jgi:hypothetical protein